MGALICADGTGPEGMSVCAVHYILEVGSSYARRVSYSDKPNMQQQAAAIHVNPSIPPGATAEARTRLGLRALSTPQLSLESNIQRVPIFFGSHMRDRSHGTLAVCTPGAHHSMFHLRLQYTSLECPVLRSCLYAALR